MIQDVAADLAFVRGRWKKSAWQVILSGRGFHALLFYRCAHALWQRRVPLLPLILTRVITILYAIDLDYRCRIAGGVAIIHGIGTVIGGGAEVGRGTIIYHGVTMGIKGSRKRDGFPRVGSDCVLGAGCKLLGGLTVGDGSIIGANVVLTQSLPAGSIARVPPPLISALHANSEVADTRAASESIAIDG